MISAGGILGSTSRRSKVGVLAGEFLRFAGVGSVSFGIDFGVFTLLLHLGVMHLVSSSISFSLSVVVNYVLTRKFVFAHGPSVNVAREFVYYALLNVVALGFNTFVLYACVDLGGMNPLFGKIIATAVVMVFNFVTRKLLIEQMSRGSVDGPSGESGVCGEN